MSNDLETIAIDHLEAVNGGFDFGAAHKAGVTQMEIGRVPPPYQPPQQPQGGIGGMMRNLGTTQCMLEPAMSGPLGYVSGFARNAYQQLTTPSKPAATPATQPGH
jgi:hypothetical protein